jgi:hypothetical protein
MGFMKRPKTPEPTAQEKAVVERQSRMLDEEMEESEKRLKAIARGKLGSKSLLAKTASSSAQSGVSRGFTFGGNVGGARGGGLMGGGARPSYTRSQTSNISTKEK